MDAQGLTSTERVVLVLVRLLSGSTPTTREVAELTGMTPHGARKLLLRLCRVVPLTQIEGCWRLVD